MSRNKRIAIDVDPIWVIIGLLLAAGAILLAINLITGRTPSRVAVHVGLFNFDIFWYGIIIVSGIALGSYVTARLAREKGEWELANHIPVSLRKKPIADLELGEAIEKKLADHKVTTLGPLLLQWGFNPALLGLKDEEQDVVEKKLDDLIGVKTEWLEDAPWRQWNPDFVWGGVAWALVLAIIGARLYHILTPSPSMAALGINSFLDYLQNPMQLINVRSGGLGIYGALAGGALGLLLFTKRHRISAIAWADLAVVGLALGQAIGRWGNFFNQELYGLPSELPWAITIDPLYRLDEYINFSRFHPAFLYASLWSLLTFFLLITLARRKREKLQTGDLLAIYLVMFATGRIITELVRLDSRNISLAGVDLGVPVATLVSVIIALPMAALLIYRHLIRRCQT